MVESGSGWMLEQAMRAGWKDTHPQQQYIGKYLDLFKANRLANGEFVALKCCKAATARIIACSRLPNVIQTTDVQRNNWCVAQVSVGLTDT